MSGIANIFVETNQTPTQTLDREEFFRYRYLERQKTATGAEYLVYKYIPYSVVKSFAFAIDPLSKLKENGGKIALTTRKRTNVMTNLGNSRSSTRKTESRTRNIVKDKPQPDSVFKSEVTTARTFQPTLTTTSLDTTVKTRKAWEPMGEFDNIKYSLTSPPRSTVSTDDIYTHAYFPALGVHDLTHLVARRMTTSNGPAAWLSKGSVETYGASLRTRCTSAMQKHGFGMLTKALPTSRSFGLFRAVAELKDLPRSIENLRRTTLHLKQFYGSINFNDLAKLAKEGKVVTKDIPKEYLGYHFGWKLLLKDILDALATPEKVAKRIAYLQTRSEKATVFRQTRTMSLPGTSSLPTFNYDAYAEEGSVQIATSEAATLELRLAMNAVFSFPTTGVPEFRQKLYLEKLGVLPNFTDLYNLTPWTWLVDWFTGLGNYIECIETINNDPSLINWATLTGKVTARATTHYSSTCQQLKSVQEVPSSAVIVNTYPRKGHASYVDVTFQLRKDICNLFDVSTTADPDSLNPYQKSILGAIIASRRKYAK